MSQAGNADAGPEGLGGWLILPTIGLVLSPFRMLFQFFTELAPLFDSEAWRERTEATLPGHKPGLMPIPDFLVSKRVANTFRANNKG